MAQPGLRSQEVNFDLWVGHGFCGFLRCSKLFAIFGPFRGLAAAPKKKKVKPRRRPCNGAPPTWKSCKNTAQATLFATFRPSWGLLTPRHQHELPKIARKSARQCDHHHPESDKARARVPKEMTRTTTLPSHGAAVCTGEQHHGTRRGSLAATHKHRCCVAECKALATTPITTHAWPRVLQDSDRLRDGRSQGRSSTARETRGSQAKGAEKPTARSQPSPGEPGANQTRASRSTRSQT